MLDSIMHYALPVLIAVGGWAWSKIRGEKTQSIADLAKGFARQAVEQVLNIPGAQDKAAEFIEGKVIDGLAQRLGVSASTLQTYEPIIHPIVEGAVADLMAEIRKRTVQQKALQASLEHLTQITKLLAPEQFDALYKKAHDKAAAQFADVVEPAK